MKLLLIVLLVGTCAGSNDYIDGLQDELNCYTLDGECTVDGMWFDACEDYKAGVYAAADLADSDCLTKKELREDALGAIASLKKDDPKRYIILRRLIQDA